MPSDLGADKVPSLIGISFVKTPYLVGFTVLAFKIGAMNEHASP